MDTTNHCPVCAVLQGDLDESRAEVERLQAIRDAAINQAQIWDGEAKTHKGTVDEVGRILGGIPDWGPVAKAVQAKVDEVERLRELLRDIEPDIARAWRAFYGDRAGTGNDVLARIRAALEGKA